MLPKFTSYKDRITFLKVLPATLNYESLLKEDFGFIAPKEASQQELETMWKYRVAKDTFPEASDDIEKFTNELTFKQSVIVENHTNRKEKYVPLRKNGGFKKGLVGKPSIRKEDGRYYGYIGDVMVINSQSEKYILNTFEKKGYKI